MIIKRICCGHVNGQRVDELSEGLNRSQTETRGSRLCAQSGL